MQTNLVYFQTEDIPAAALADRLADLGVGILPTGSHKLRAVTNLMVNEGAIDEALNRIEEAIADLKEDHQARPVTASVAR